MEERMRALGALQRLKSPDSHLSDVSACFSAEGVALSVASRPPPKYLKIWFGREPASWSLDCVVLLLDLGDGTPSGLLLAPQIDAAGLKVVQLRFVLTSETRKQIERSSTLSVQPRNVRYKQAAKVYADADTTDFVSLWYYALTTCLAAMVKDGDLDGEGFKICAAFLGKLPDKPADDQAWAKFLQWSTASLNFLSEERVLRGVSTERFHAELRERVG